MYVYDLVWSPGASLTKWLGWLEAGGFGAGAGALGFLAFGLAGLAFFFRLEAGRFLGFSQNGTSLDEGACTA